MFGGGGLVRMICELWRNGRKGGKGVILLQRSMKRKKDLLTTEKSRVYYQTSSSSFPRLSLCFFIYKLRFII